MRRTIAALDVKYEEVEGGRAGAVDAANEIIVNPRQLRRIGIKAVDDRVLWVANEAGLTFYYREEVCEDEGT